MKILNEKNMSRLNSQIQSSSKKGEKVVVLGQGDEFNRKMLENKKVDMLILNDAVARKDYMKQRNSGLNEVLSKLAAKNKIKIGVELGKILKKSDIEKAQGLSRLAQNIMLCKKAKCDLIALGDIDKKSIRSLFLSLGSSTSQAKKASEESFFN